MHEVRTYFFRSRINKTYNSHWIKCQPTQIWYYISLWLHQKFLLKEKYGLIWEKVTVFCVDFASSFSYFSGHILPYQPPPVQISLPRLLITQSPGFLASFLSFLLYSNVLKTVLIVIYSKKYILHYDLDHKVYNWKRKKL